MLDANVLLDLFRVSDETAQLILEILEKLKDRMWLPHQAAEEYHRNLAGVLAEQQGKYEVTLDQIKMLLESFTRQRMHPFIDRNLMSEVESLFEKVRSELEERRDSLANSFFDHPLKDKVANLFEGKVGDPFDSDRLAEIYKDGEMRYRNGIPPGFEDRKKEPESRKYGDLVMWMQILDKVQNIDDGIIFVTNDVKEDWYLRKSERILGPRAELVAELKNIRNVPFYIYTAEQFMTYSNEHLEASIGEEFIEEVRDLEEENTASNTFLSEVAPSADALARLSATLYQPSEIYNQMARLRATLDRPTEIYNQMARLRATYTQPETQVEDGTGDDDTSKGNIDHDESS